jgi:D-alanine-D-alanine ligase
MTGHSLVPMSARAAGISYEALCLQILRSARLDTPARPSPAAGRAGQP